jgi:cytidylate kinase
VRTLRRFNQLSSRNQNECLDLTQIKQMILKRDIEDSSREYAPLVLMPDAFLLDTSELNFDLTIEEIKKYIEFKKIMIAALKKTNFNQENYEEIYFEENNQNNKN